MFQIQLCPMFKVVWVCTEVCFKYLGVYISNELKDDASITHQCRNMYDRGNMIIRNFTQCSDAVKCHLFQSFCTSFYCSSLWSSYNVETLKRLKVAYNRIFRTLMGLQQRARMSENLIRRGLDPFKVVMRKLVCSFRTRIIQSNNVLLETVVDSNIRFIDSFDVFISWLSI